MLANRRPFVPGLWHGRPLEPEQSDATDDADDDMYDSEFEEEFGELYEPLDRVFRVSCISLLVSPAPATQALAPTDDLFRRWEKKCGYVSSVHGTTA